MKKSQVNLRFFVAIQYLLGKRRLRIDLFVILLIINMLTGCMRKYERDDGRQAQMEGQLRNLTQTFLVEKISKIGFGGRAFCAYKTLDITKSDNSNVNEYIFAACQEYYPEDGVLKKGTGCSMPIAIYIENQKGTYKIIDYKLPRNGSMYSYDVEHIFPKKTHEQIFHTGVDSSLWNEAEQEALDYYKNVRIQ